jgi:hypothetical protein
MWRLPILAILLASCGFLPRVGHPTSVPPASDLATRAQLYTQLAPSVLDPSGFVDVARCDSTTFSGLLGSSGVDVDLLAAEVGPGQWLRRPTAYPECWAAGESRSTISRDALLSVMWWAWSNSDLATLERLWAYGAAHSWRMGRGRLAGADTLANPNIVSLLAHSIYALGGRPPAWALAIIPAWAADVEGYERHLQVAQITLWGEVVGSIPAGAAELLAQHAASQPGNPVMRAASDRWLGTQLSGQPLDTRLWPADRLPTSEDRCSAWVAMNDRDENGWKACPTESETHTGGELIFAQRILRGKN